jgi:dephospho-CoA kinase
MRVIVVTGGLGSGKSTAAEHLRAKGAISVDLDQVAEKLMSPGTPLLERVAAEFGGDDVLLADGRLDRAALARLAFASRESADRLNMLVHPAVARDLGTAIEQLRLMPEPPSAVVVQVPLLVEAPVIGELADVVVAIVAPESVRVARASGAGMPSDEAVRRVRLQATDAERAELADVVIVNDGARDGFLARLDEFWEEYVAVGGEAR